MSAQPVIKPYVPNKRGPRGNGAQRFDATTIPEHAPKPTAKFLAFAEQCRELLIHYELGGTGALQNRTKLIHHREERGSRRHPVVRYSDMRACAAAVEEWMSTSQSGAFPSYRL